jgi:hypothetical protein
LHHVPFGCVAEGEEESRRGATDAPGRSPGKLPPGLLACAS